MGWQDQGRQYHGWFGDGTSENTIFKPESVRQRIEAAAHGAIASLPSDLRARASGQYQAGGLARLTPLMAAWAHGARLDQASFAQHFFGRDAADPVMADLRAAAQEASLAEDHAALREAADHLASAMQSIGLDRWPDFVADAEARAKAPATLAAVEQSWQPPHRDPIHPVDPLGDVLSLAPARAVPALAADAMKAATTPKARAIIRKTAQGVLEALVPRIKALRIEKAIQAALRSINEGTRLEGEVARMVQEAGQEVAIFQKKFFLSKEISEIDVGTPNVLIEATIQIKGKLDKIEELISNRILNPDKKVVILYAPRYRGTPAKAVLKAGGLVAKTPDELKRLIIKAKN